MYEHLKNNIFSSSAKIACRLCLRGLKLITFVIAAYNRLPIGIEDGRIPNSAITASSKWDNNHGPSNARLNNKKRGRKTGAWSAKKNRRGQWIQIYLGKRTQITAILTQGRQDANQWVTSYTVRYSNNGRNFRPYKPRGRTKVCAIL